MNDLFTALSKFQAELTPAVKDSMNSHFRNKYADLASIWDVIQAPLGKNGLCVVQLTDFVDGVTVLRTIIGHTSGQMLESTYPLKPSKDDPQGYGSAMTYARRYCLAAALGVVQDDDDGNEASKPKTQAEKAQAAKRAMEIVKEIGAISSEVELKAYGKKLANETDAVREAVRDAYEKRLNALRGAA